MNKKRKGIVLLLLAFLLSVILGIPHTEPVLAATPRLNKTNVSLVKGGQVKLSVAGTSKKVKWSSTQKKVAVVTNNGLVRAKSKGTARIIAKVGKKRLICHVVVRRPKENVTTGGLSLSATRISIKVGKFKQLRAFGTNKKISWYSTDESIAAVSKDGVVYGVSPGNCRIYAEIPGKYAICMVSVFGGTQNTPTPTIWNTPVATITQAPTPIPTETYLPTPTSQPTPTYLPTPTARPTQVPVTPTPTPIVVVTQTPTPIPTSRPTVTSAPTPTPIPTPVITQPPVSDSKQKISLLESGWRTFSSWDYTYISWAVRIKNPNARYAVEYPTITVTARDSSGRILKNEERVLSAIAANDTIIYGDTLAYEGAEPSRVDISVSCEDEWFSAQDSKRFVTQKSFAFSNISKIDKTDENISVYTGEITNNSGVNFSTVAAMVVYSKSGKVVGGEVTYIDNLRAGATKPFEFRAYSGVTQYDSYSFYAVQW